MGVLISEKWQKNKQTNIRLHLETAALPTELYPCICVKLFSLQAFLPAKSIIPQRYTKSQDFLKNSITNLGTILNNFERSEIVERIMVTNVDVMKN